MYEALTFFILIICCLSMASTSFVIASYFRYRQLRVTEFKYILYICFADFMFAIIVFFSCVFHFAGLTYPPAVCKF